MGNKTQNKKTQTGDAMTSRNIKTSRKLSFQQLEDRRMMTGKFPNVTANLTGGTLTITGDGYGEAIQVTETQFGGQNAIAIFPIQGEAQSGLTSAINGYNSAAVFQGVTGDVNINMQGANDVVEISANINPNYNGANDVINLSHNLNVNLGNGSNTFIMGTVHVAGKVSITGGSANDFVNIQNCKVGSYTVNNGADDLTISLGGGTNSTSVTNSDIFEDLNILDSSSTQDSIHVHSDQIGRYLYIQTGSGNDSVNLAAITATYVNLSTGAGNDIVHLGYDPTYGGNGLVNAADSIYADLGAGNDSLYFDSVSSKQGTFYGGAGTDHTYGLNSAPTWYFNGFEPIVIVPGVAKKK
jgi:hypothetical protein